jgi:hypothetical protein
MRPDDKWEAKSRTTQARYKSHDYGREKLQGLGYYLEARR